MTTMSTAASHHHDQPPARRPRALGRSSVCSTSRSFGARRRRPGVPPVVVIVLSALLGLISVACAVIAWRSGNRLADPDQRRRADHQRALSLPAFFVDIDAWIKAGAALSVILTVVALVLTLRREPTPYTVTD